MIVSKDEIEQLNLKTKLRVNKKSNDQTLEKLKSGRTTFKTMFKGANQKDQLMNTMEQDITTFDREIELYTNIINIIESHIARYVIPRFNRDKAMLYYKMLEYFSVHEIHN